MAQSLISRLPDRHVLGVVPSLDPQTKLCSSLVTSPSKTQTFSLFDDPDLDYFAEYLWSIQGAKLLLRRKGADKTIPWGELPPEDKLSLPYKTRFCESRVKDVLGKFADVMRHYRDQPYVHLTLTSGQRDRSIAECIFLLKYGWNKLRTLLTKRHGKLDYILALEPHKSGYAHLHVLIFTKKYVMKQSKLSSLWRKYGVGRQVWIKRYWNWGRDPKGMKYLSKYLSKYFKDVPVIIKAFSGSQTSNSSFSRHLLNRLKFYYCLWYNRFKNYSMSKSMYNFVFRYIPSGLWEFVMVEWRPDVMFSMFSQSLSSMGIIEP